MSVMGIGVAGILVTLDCISAKIIDDDYERHGVKREGMLTSLIGVMGRLSGIYVSLGYKVIGSAFGFESGLNPGTIRIWHRGSCSACSRLSRWQCPPSLRCSCISKTRIKIGSF